MGGSNQLKQIGKSLFRWRKVLIVILVPLLLVPVAKAGDSKVSRCAFAVLVIGTFWVTEAMPLAATSLLPVVLFPLLEVVPVRVVCASYFNDTLMLFLGSLIVAVAVERWGLHKRIALRALTLVGPEPKMLMLGLMVPCWFLSMWMSNTATTAMMVPILNAILLQIKECRENDSKNVDTAAVEQQGKETSTELQCLTPNGVDNVTDTEANVRVCNENSEDKEFTQLAKTFALCTAYAANIGGVATLTGTPPNIVFKGVADSVFEKVKAGSGVTFANWLVVGFPLSLICLVFTWFWLQYYYAGTECFKICRKNKGSFENVRMHLQREYRSLGKMTFAETVVLIVFVLLAVLWVTRKPEFIPGWGSLYPAKYVGDSCPAMLMAVVLFVLPSTPPVFCSSRSTTNDDNSADESSHDVADNNTELVPLLNWEVVNQKLPWGVIILMGGGFALADACSASGLSDAISEQLKALDSMPPIAVALILAFVIAAATNITSNSATATLFLPIVGKLAVQLGVHPLYFMIPCALAASFAFLLPVGTPPNAIVFSTGYLTVKDMLVAGSVVNVFTVLFAVISMVVWIIPFYGLDVLPEELRAHAHNLTAVVMSNNTLTQSYNTTDVS